eukprot:3285183-Rhodomonas_salina.2
MVWNAAMTSSGATGILNTETNAAVIKKLGSNWTDWQKCMYADEEQYSNEVKCRRTEFLVKASSILINKLSIAIFGKDFKKKHLTAAELLLPVLFDPEMEEVLDGTNTEKTKDWTEKPYLILGIQVWAKLMFRFEGVSDTVSCNLLKELNYHEES